MAMEVGEVRMSEIKDDSVAGSENNVFQNIDDVIYSDNMMSIEDMRRMKELKLKTRLLGFFTSFATLLIIVVIILIALYERKSRLISHEIPKEHPEDYCSNRDCVVIASRMIEAMNLTVDPCHDFYEYACGGWLHKTAIPEYFGRISRGVELREKNEITMKEIINDLEKNKLPASTAPLKKALRYYKSCTDVRQLERIGDKPMKKIIKVLGSWPVTDPYFKNGSWNLLDALVSVNKIGVTPLFNLLVGRDEKDSSSYTLLIYQSGIGMDGRSSYLSNKTRHVKKRKAYVKWMKGIAKQMGSNESGLKLLDEVFEFETSLARITQTTYKYEKMLLGDYINITGVPQELVVNLIQQTVLLNEKTIYLNQTIISYNTEYITKAMDLFMRLRTEVKASYLIWCSVRYLSPVLKSVSPYKIIFEDYEGVQDERPRWRTCVQHTVGLFGYALSRFYVDRVFDKTAKELAQELIQEVKDTFERNIEKMHWIDQKTREYGKKKAAMIMENIAYPGKIFNNTKLENEFADLTVLDGQYLMNVIEAAIYQTKQNYLKFGRPVDKMAWVTQPTTVNAFYDPEDNKITFPAGILQWPFYDRRSPRAVSYGGIGMFVGHEISHGFDNNGMKYNIDGELKNWWSNKSAEEFEKRSQCFIDQYNNFTLYGEYVNGTLTLGENIADNGGVRQSFQAYRSWVERNGPEKKLPGLNLKPEQMYFVAFAQMLCAKLQKSTALEFMESEEHALSRFRVTGALQNFADFSKVYNCPIGSVMNPKKKCRLW